MEDGKIDTIVLVDKHFQIVLMRKWHTVIPLMNILEVYSKVVMVVGVLMRGGVYFKL